MRKLKISLGFDLVPGAWGGGNQFAAALTHYLQGKGVEICFDLKAPDLDLIFLHEPDARLRISAYGYQEVLNYLCFKNRRCLVVHRINNTSEAREEENKAFNKFRVNVNRLADHTVFISRWVYERYVECGFRSPHFSIILNGGNSLVWKKKASHKRKASLSLVTHHWSNHPNKGFDIYRKLDHMLEKPEWARKVSFTYIGRLPDGFEFRNAKCLEPLAGQELVAEIQKHDVYLTASLNEAAGMHHIEGALCGLPLLYRESGALPEYCNGFGVSFTAENFEEKLREMVASYNQWLDHMGAYPFTSEKMSADYYDLFQNLVAHRDEILRRRRWPNDHIWIAKTLLSRVLLPIRKRLPV